MCGQYNKHYSLNDTSREKRLRNCPMTLSNFHNCLYNEQIITTVINTQKRLVEAHLKIFLITLSFARRFLFLVSCTISRCLTHGNRGSLDLQASDNRDFHVYSEACTFSIDTSQNRKQMPQLQKILLIYRKVCNTK